MKLAYVFEQLTQGELSQVAIGGQALGEISEDNYQSVANHVRLGLTALYKRFNLKQGQLTVELVNGQYVYPLLSKYAVTGKGTEPIRWLKDTLSEPFKEDILKILSIRGDTGCVFPMNDYTDDYSIATPRMDTLRVPTGINDKVMDLPDLYKTDYLSVSYQANHPAITTVGGLLDPMRVEIELPDSHLQALLYFVASRVHNPIGMGQEFNAGNNWNARYEQECQRLEADGDEIYDAPTNFRAQRGGWV